MLPKLSKLESKGNLFDEDDETPGSKEIRMPQSTKNMNDILHLDTNQTFEGMSYLERENELKGHERVRQLSTASNKLH